MAGGGHHTSFSQSVTTRHLEDFAEISGLEFLVIDNLTSLANLKNELKWNDMYYLLAKGL
jgi:L-arabinose isomerase